MSATMWEVTDVTHRTDLKMLISVLDPDHPLISEPRTMLGRLAG
ncbi:hypothetical protein ACFS2C_02375 [Prauserella oleivorans]|uniref:Uncharacterized protein n=1 Tax=Prauserella oleivorans TaxID=1478153 RepID=A0ABW5W6Q4_9PSEU